jgi:hypothetical protein
MARPRSRKMRICLAVGVVTLAVSTGVLLAIFAPHLMSAVGGVLAIFGFFAWLAEKGGPEAPDRRSM